MALVIDPVATQLLDVLGMTVLSGMVAAVVAGVYRASFGQRIPSEVALLAGVSAVAIYLNTRGALGAVVIGNVGYLEFEAVVFNTVAFLTAGLVTPLALRVGDRIVSSAVAISGVTDVEGEVSKFVTTVGRRTPVHMPEKIADIEGYDPVPDSVTENLAGRTLLFPKRLTVGELHDRLVTRLKADYDVGYVDAEVAADGTVEYLALGQRVAGIGPTLGPGQAVVAIEADPPNAASSGDLVQVWDEGEEMPSRVTTGEIRGVAGDTVTVALDATDARAIAGHSYRLVTLPVQPAADREFAGLLRAAAETMATVTVEADSTLAGRAIRDVDATVVAIKPADGEIQPIPPRDRTLDAGDRVYLVARPAVIRSLGAESTAT